MPKQSKRKFSGSIFKRKSRNTLYILFQGKEISTGLKDNPLGWKLAEKQLEKLNIEFLQSSGRIDTEKSITQHWKDFIEYKSLRVSARTLSDYTKSVERSGLLHCQLNEIEIKNCLRNFVDQCLKSPTIHKRTITIKLREIFVFLNYLAEKRALPKLRKKEFDVDGGQKPYMSYTESEYKAIYEYFLVADYEISQLIKFLWITGARIKETLDLTWNDIDFKNREIKFPVKNRKEHLDNFPITVELESLLLRQKELNSEKVFRWTAQGTSFVGKKLKECTLKLGIYQPSRLFHGFRKSFAEKLFNSKKDIAITRRLMRHKNIETTIKYYNHYSNKELLSELESL